MAKRSTIGENPLDAVIGENSLDTVVPDLAAVTRTGRAQPALPLSPALQERLQELEAAFKTLRTEVAGLQGVAGQLAALKGEVARMQGGLAELGRALEPLKAEAATAKALREQVAQLQEMLTQLRASAGPGDLPWWMRGKKK